MTGYGRGAAAIGREGGGARRVVVEMKSVNHRFLDLKQRGAPLEPAIEEKLTGIIRKALARGAVTVSVRFDGGGGQPTVRPDHDAARRALRELSELALALRLDQPISLELVCAQPGVMVPRDTEDDGEALASAVVAAASEAVDRLVEMREAEGAALGADLAARLGRLGELAEQVGTLAARAPGEALGRLRDRLSRLLEDQAGAPDEQRLAQEIAVLADRQDITEEIVRLRSHIKQFVKLMNGSGPAGRRLDFLVQELGREINTIGSKSQSADIAALVVEAKAELERVREQVQNLE